MRIHRASVRGLCGLGAVQFIIHSRSRETTLHGIFVINDDKALEIWDQSSIHSTYFLSVRLYFREVEILGE